ncbi:MAG: FKBP-type peptidyl-prolyl cis-trans isomerase [Bacteroidota bacterium]
MKLYHFTSTILLLSGLFLGLACSNNSASTDQSGDAASKVSEDDLIGRLSSSLVANPTSQADIDRNLIINYAIDKELDVQSLSSGMYYQIIRPGEGTAPTINSKVRANYQGQLLDGSEFDSSYKRGKPLDFNLRQVVPGWQQGIPLIKPGGKIILLVPSAMAYGAQGYPPVIPPNAVLRFDVELLEVF